MKWLFDPIKMVFSCHLSIIWEIIMNHRWLFRLTTALSYGEHRILQLYLFFFWFMNVVSYDTFMTPASSINTHVSTHTAIFISVHNFTTVRTISVWSQLPNWTVLLNNGKMMDIFSWYYVAQSSLFNLYWYVKNVEMDSHALLLARNIFLKRTKQKSKNKFLVIHLNASGRIHFFFGNDSPKFRQQWTNIECLGHNMNGCGYCCRCFFLKYKSFQSPSLFGMCCITFEIEFYHT